MLKIDKTQKVAILVSFSLIRFFVLSFILIPLSSSLEIGIMRRWFSLLSTIAKDVDVLKLFNVAGVIENILI